MAEEMGDWRDGQRREGVTEQEGCEGGHMTAKE